MQHQVDLDPSFHDGISRPLITPGPQSASNTDSTATMLGLLSGPWPISTVLVGALEAGGQGVGSTGGAVHLSRIFKMLSKEVNRRGRVKLHTVVHC